MGIDGKLAYHSFVFLATVTNRRRWIHDDITCSVSARWFVFCRRAGLATDVSRLSPTVRHAQPKNQSRCSTPLLAHAEIYECRRTCQPLRCCHFSDARRTRSRWSRTESGVTPEQGTASRLVTLDPRPCSPVLRQVVLLRVRLRGRVPDSANKNGTPVGRFASQSFKTLTSGLAIGTRRVVATPFLRFFSRTVKTIAFRSRSPTSARINSLRRTPVKAAKHAIG